MDAISLRLDDRSALEELLWCTLQLGVLVLLVLVSVTVMCMRTLVVLPLMLGRLKQLCGVVDVRGLRLECLESSFHSLSTCARGTDGLLGGSFAELARVWPPMSHYRGCGDWVLLGTDRSCGLCPTILRLRVEDVMEAWPRQWTQSFDHGDEASPVCVSRRLLGRSSSASCTGEEGRYWRWSLYLLSRRRRLVLCGPWCEQLRGPRANDVLWRVPHRGRGSCLPLACQVDWVLQFGLSLGMEGRSCMDCVETGPSHTALRPL